MPLRHRALVLALSCGLLGGPLVAADSPEIISLRTKAERGNAIAQYNLGLALATGRDTPANLPEAFVWLTLAEERGATGRVLRTILGEMTPDQLAEGNRLLATMRGRFPAPGVTRTITSPGAVAPAPNAAVLPSSNDPSISLLPPAPAPQPAAELPGEDTSGSVPSARTIVLDPRADAASPAAAPEVSAALVQRNEELEALAGQRGRALAETQQALAQARSQLTELAEIRTAAETARREAGALNQQVAQLTASQAALAQQLAAARAAATDSSALANDLNSARTEAETIRRELAARTQALERLTAERDHLAVTAREAAGREDELTRRLAEAVALRDQVAALNADKRQLSAELATA